MRFIAVVCFAPLLAAGCMPMQGQGGPSANFAEGTRLSEQVRPAPQAVAATQAPTVLASTFVAPANAPLPPPRPDFEGVTLASRSLGALAKEAEEVENGTAPPIVASDEPEPAKVETAAYAPAPAPPPVAEPATPRMDTAAPAPAPQPKPPGNIRSPGYYAAYDDTIIGCFPEKLRDALNDIATHYGKQVEVTSGMRARGRSHSMHRSCMAADIRVEGVGPRSLAAYARTVDGVNGVGTYRFNDVTHVDIRQERISWRY